MVQYDKKAGKLWYLMPFEANIKTDYVEYNVVFQWVGWGVSPARIVPKLPMGAKRSGHGGDWPSSLLWGWLRGNLLQAM